MTHHKVQIINSTIRHLKFWYISVLYKSALFGNLLWTNNETKSVKIMELD